MGQFIPKSNKVGDPLSPLKDPWWFWFFTLRSIGVQTDLLIQLETSVDSLQKALSGSH